MKKESKSYRFNRETLDKIETLFKMEQQQAENFQITPKSRTDIIEDAIAEYFSIKLDKDIGNDYLNRINLAIQNAIKKETEITDKTLNVLLQTALQSYEASLTILKYLRLDANSIPEDESQASRLVKEINSIFEEPIQEKVEDILIGKEDVE